MPLVTALYTGMSGLTVNQTALDVIGNNIANVNTTAFKGARALFQPEYSETYSFGTPPGETFGGSNPSQKGLGVRVGTIQRNFAAGNTKLTGIATDVAIDGDGMFVVEDRERYYTRVGHFQLNSDDYLTTSDGRYVMGYSVDANYNVVQGTLTRVRIPMNKITVARPTSQVVMDGQLGGRELVASTLGTILTSSKLTDTAGAGGEVSATSRLVDLERHDPHQAGGVAEQVFFEGTTLTFEGQRGEGRLQGSRTLDVAAATTVEDLMNFLVDAFGVHTDPELTPPGGQQAGAEIVANLDGAGDPDGTWSIRITGNAGEQNAILPGAGGLRSNDPNVPGPLQFQVTQNAVGSSVFTSFDAYDSLGNTVKVDLTFVFESQDNAGRTWRFFANSLDDTDVSSVLGSGTVQFDTDGEFLEATNTIINIDRDNTGTMTPLSINLDLSRLEGIVKEGQSRVQLTTQDGEPAGTLTDFSIAQDGRIIGSFNNGATRMLGQLAVATFSNYGGLIDAGENVFRAGPNSGEAIIGVPLANGAGQVFGGAVETSNVDISREFIDMIVASTGFSASSRVITTSNQLLTELLSIVR